MRERARGVCVRACVRVLEVCVPTDPEEAGRRKTKTDIWKEGSFVYWSGCVSASAWLRLRLSREVSDVIFKSFVSL